MTGKIQRKNKTNKVNKKAKHARRTRRVSRKTLNKRKQRKGGDGFMSKFGICNIGESKIEIKDMSGNSIEGKTFKNKEEGQTKIDRICKSGNDVFFMSNKTRIKMDAFKDKYPEYEFENGKFIKYKFESENDNYKLIEDTDKDNKMSFFNRFNPFKRSS